MAILLLIDGNINQLKNVSIRKLDGSGLSVRGKLYQIPFAL